VNARLVEKSGTLKVTSIFRDQGYGHEIDRLVGRLEGTRAMLRLLPSYAGADFVPLSGQLQLDFAADNGSAQGTWQTDLGTQGMIALRPVRSWFGVWWWRVATAAFQVWVWRGVPSLYVLAYVTITALVLAGKIDLSYPALILVLVPLPLVLHRQIGALLNFFGVTKIGPVERQAETHVAAILRQVDVHLRQAVDGAVQEAVHFAILDNALVPRTKLLLILVAVEGPFTREEFNKRAAALGAPADDIEPTWAAILASRCAGPSNDGHLTITPLGQRYLARLAQAAPASAVASTQQ
jgi:hypothetical protein